MAIIIDIKNAVRKAIHTKDSAVNFFFNEILKVKYPYVFFYIPSFRIDKAIDTEYWRKITLMCVAEYAKSEDNKAVDLWEYCDTLTEAFKSFEFLDTRISATNIEFKTIDSVLQMTFDLECYVKAVDETELMKDLDLTLKQI